MICRGAFAPKISVLYYKYDSMTIRGGWGGMAKYYDWWQGGEGVQKHPKKYDIIFERSLSIAACNRDTSILTRADHLDNEHFNDKLSEVSEGIGTLKGTSLVDIVKNWVTVSSCDVSSPQTDDMFYEKSHVTKKEKLSRQCNRDSEMENFSVTIKSRKPFVDDINDVDYEEEESLQERNSVNLPCLETPNKCKVLDHSFVKDPIKERGNTF